MISNNVASLLYVIGVIVLYGSVIYFFIYIIRYFKRLDTNLKKLIHKIEKDNNERD
jgi:predicted neutral ceramidase superfamily lipid hydrolase